MPVVLNLILILILAASLRIWFAIFRRWRAGESLIAWEPREAVPWGPLEIVLAVGIFLFATQAILGIGNNPEPAPAAPPKQEEILAAVGRDVAENSPVGQVEAAPQAPLVPPAKSQPAIEGIPQLIKLILVQIVTGLACLAFLRVGSRVNLRDLGLNTGDLAKDARYGLLALIAVAPATFLVQLILVKWFPSHHPIVDMVGKSPGIGLFLCTTLLAVVVAPWCEEFFFRVLLQGWLETAAAKMREEPNDPALPISARWPIFVSSLIFALMHASHGPDPIPLFLLALALGYLYRQTHRIWPSYVMHACFNATSMAMLGLSLLEGGSG